MLNALIKAHEGLALGLSSIGLDGEELDAISRLPKPRVWLREGALVATAADCLRQSEAAFSVLERTGLRTGLGEILIAKVNRAGNCLLGGPSTAGGMRQAQEALRRHGAEKLFIDGAFSRQSHAAAAEAMVFVVGAHQSTSMERVAASAGLALRRFSLPGAGSSLSFLLDESRPGFLDSRNGFHPLALASPLGQPGQVLDAVPGDAPFLYLPGAVDSAMAAILVKRRREHRFGLLVQSPLSLVMADTALEKLFLLGRDIRVLRPLTLAFVAMNPCSPAGHRFDAAAFRAALRAVTDLPIFDAMEDGFTA